MKYSSTGRKGYGLGVHRNWPEDPTLSDSGFRLFIFLEGHSEEYLRQLNVVRIAEQMHWSPDRVTRTLAHLAKHGLVTVEQVPKEDGRAGTRTLISLHLDVWTSGGEEVVPHGVVPPEVVVPHDEVPVVQHGVVPVVPHGEVRTTSTPNSRTTNVGVLPVFDEQRPAAMLCNHLADAIALDGKRPTVTKAWVVEMQRIIDLDHHPADEVLRVINWLANGQDGVAVFWRPNIRSPQKLRQKWDQMAGQFRAHTARRPESLADAYVRRAAEGQG